MIMERLPHLPGLCLTGAVLAAVCVLGASGYDDADQHPSVKFCPVPSSGDHFERISTEYFECPGPDDPVDYTLCCEERCCPELHLDSVMRIDIKIAMAISITVISISVITGITLLICCFVYPCPLYDTCGGGYKRTENSALSFNDIGGKDTIPLTSNGTMVKYQTTKNEDVMVEKAEAV